MSNKEIVFDAVTVTTHVANKYSVDVRVTAEADLQTLFDNFNATDVLEFIDRGAFLDSIGEEYVRQHFGIDAEE